MADRWRPARPGSAAVVRRRCVPAAAGPGRRVAAAGLAVGGPRGCDRSGGASARGWRRTQHRGTPQTG
ncbi:MAG: hypothetical protein ACK55I_35445, partial [bacterium]